MTTIFNHLGQRRLRALVVFFLLGLGSIPYICDGQTTKSSLVKIAPQEIGWGTHDVRSVLTHVHIDAQQRAKGIVIGLHKTAKNGELFLTEALIGRKTKDAEVVTIGAHNNPFDSGKDGAYTSCTIAWQGATFRLETYARFSQWATVVTCLQQPAMPVYLTVTTRNFWSGPYPLFKEPNLLVLNPISGSRLAHNYPNGGDATEVLIKQGESRVIQAAIVDQKMVGNLRFQADSSVKRQVAALADGMSTRDEMYRKYVGPIDQDSATVARATLSTLAWNTIYDPTKKRLLTVVNRIWSVERGGYVVFCWDNFFGAILWSKFSREAAISNFVSTLDEVTPDGFVPNNSQGNGRAAWDRSQPPVGTLALRAMNLDKELINQRLAPEIKKLITWNNWWWANRKNGALLSWGSRQGKVPNRFADAAWNNRLAAALESGADDSPAYDDVPFDPKSGLLMLHDVGLNSLYANDCALLATYAKLLGLLADADTLLARNTYIKTHLAKLWDDKAGIYKNRHVTGNPATDTLSSVITPFNFLPILAGVPSPAKALRMTHGWMRNPLHFGGPYPLPSVDKQHPSYFRQQYWRGATWPPMNYLVLTGLRTYPNLAADAHWLGEASFQLFLNEYQRKGYIGENYSNITGTCDDGLVKAETNYFWGCLLGIMR